MVRPYELVCVLSPEIETEAVESLLTRWQDLITQEKGEIEKVEQWGKRRLAYEIAKRTEGFYVFLAFRAEPEVAKELERVVKLTDSVIRHLLVRLEEDK